MKKCNFSTELAYVFGLLILAFGTALMERANFGMSMVVAPAYVLHLKLCETFSWFTFGVAEYCLQALLLIIVVIVLRKFKLAYIFSFITAFIYGNVLDLMIFIVKFIPGEGFVSRIIFFIVGMLLSSLGVAFFFHTYITPEAYELIVMELSRKLNKDIHKVKTVYDLISCAVAIIMSFAFFGLFQFRGVNIGTVVTALINGLIIAFFSKTLEKMFEFKDKFKLRQLFDM